MGRELQVPNQLPPSPVPGVDEPAGTVAFWQAVAVRRVGISAAALVVVLGGCDGTSATSEDNQSPEERLAEAKQGFDDADYIAFTLTADELPADLEGLLSAEGTGTHDPAFTGEVKVQTNVDLSAPLIALDGLVYAELPFLGWSRLDPADYGAPNPADLMDPQAGISSLFTASAELSEGSAERSGEEVLTSIEGTLPSEAVNAVFPSAGSADFSVTYTLTDNNDVRSALITGPFYEGSPNVTYTIDLDLEGEPVEIEAPL